MNLLYLAALCAIGCSYEGFDTGKYIDKKCACIEYYDPDLFLIKKVKKPKQKPAEKEE